ncbi:2'-5' RNA ligase family protein [Angustibacter aerolatus]
MGHTVELVPDDALEAWVRAGWRALLDADLPSLAAHPSPTNAPHLTLTTTDDELPPAVAGLVRGALPLDVALGGPVVLTGRKPAVGWLLAPSEPLAELHDRVVALTGDPWPGGWLPHVSAALRVPREQVEQVLSVLHRLPPAPPGRFVAARTYDTVTRTVETL